jgi:hypothetical protein
MPIHLVPLANIPDDTARRAKYSFGKGNILIQLGDHLNELLNSLSLSNMEIQDKKLAETNTRLALITAFQVAEELTDNQVLEAVRSREDLKYALHLPMDYPSLDPRDLCKFRQQLFNDPSDLNTFQTLVDKLGEFGLLNPRQQNALAACEVLEKICTSTRIEKLLETMERALETLAVYHGDWLRMVALPLWYERYSRRSKLPFWPNGQGEWKTRTVEIGADITYLLEAIEKAQQPEIELRREVRKLRQILDEQFEVTSDGDSQAQKIQWRRRGCAACHYDQ